MACAIDGGCPSDYIAIAIAIICTILLFIRATFPFLAYKIPRTKSSGIWLLVLQTFASVNFLLSLVMFLSYLKFERGHRWRSCYIWAVWVEGPFGFGLLMCCRIVQAFQLYYLFVKRRLPPIRSRILLPSILLPWIGAAAAIQIGQPLTLLCHMGNWWVIPIICLHTLYIVALVGITWAVRHIEFRFQEFKDLLLGIVTSSTCIGIWITSYILNEIHDQTRPVQVVSRFLLLVSLRTYNVRDLHFSCMFWLFVTTMVPGPKKFYPILWTVLSLSFSPFCGSALTISLIEVASILVLTFFSISPSQPLLSQMSLRRREAHEFETMGQALGIPDSGLLLPRVIAVDIDMNEPLDKLLLNKRFRHSFMAFADSCLAGESVHFYDEVYEFSKIPVVDTVRRVYMARHIIEKYIQSGSDMEVNISHRTREGILSTTDLAHSNLFNCAISELLQLMKMNLLQDYWSSMFFVKFKEELRTKPEDNECMERVVGWDYSPRLSIVHGVDDPFHQEHPQKGSPSEM